jgi:glutathione synthase/RimK-type ligase-like ATP-grasp enzyme
MAAILILSHPTDGHAHAVAEALQWKGAGTVLWQTADFPTRSAESLLITETCRSLRVHGPAIELESPHFDSVWCRRPSLWVDPNELHPSDLQFAEVECQYFRKALYRLIAPGAFWVNPLNAQATDNKAIQQAFARQVGFRTPDTLYSNDPEAIRSFIRAHNGRIIYKPFRGVAWQQDDTYWIPYSSVLTEERLVEDLLLRLTPGIYQALVPKHYELRITVMGHSLFTARILSQLTECGRIDWRKAGDEVSMEPGDIPPHLADLCLKLMNSLGLVFGCFDFIVTPEGEHVFLELNPAGQFLFVERLTGLPLLDAFCDFLIDSRADFAYRPRGARARLADVEPVVEQRLRESLAVHVVLAEEALPEPESAV